MIKKEGDKMRELEEQKKEAIQKQDYEHAKEIKANLAELRKDVEYMANNFYDPSKKTIRPVLKESVFKDKIE